MATSRLLASARTATVSIPCLGTALKPPADPLRPAVAPGKVCRPEEPVVEERTVHHSSQQPSFGKVELPDKSPEEVLTTAREREPPHQTPECVSCAGRADTSHETVRTKEPVAPVDSKNVRLEEETWLPPLERVKLLLKCLTPMPPDT